MALRCLGTGGSRERLDLVDSSALDLPDSGWTVFLMFYPDSTVGVNTFAYMYAHGEPLTGSAPALNILLVQSTSKLRVIVDSIFTTEVDFSTSNTINVDEWNSVIVRYDSGPRVIYAHLNGVQTSQSTAFALNTLTPSGNARIGDATHGTGGREMNGRIAHPSKWDRTFSSGDANHFTSFLISPHFAQTDHIWHVPIWNASFNFDVLNVISTSPVGALYGNHAPAVYPADPMYNVPTPVPESGGFQPESVRWTLA